MGDLFIDKELRPIPGFPQYMLSDGGMTIVSFKRKRPTELKWTTQTSGYCHVTISSKTKRKTLRRHQAVWIWFNGYIPDGMLIDHVDGDNSKDGIENLRLASPTGNSMNRKKQSNNATGYIGVSWCGHRNLFAAQAHINGKQTNLGRFKTAEEANEVVVAARLKHHGEYAIDNRPINHQN